MSRRSSGQNEEDASSSPPPPLDEGDDVASAEDLLGEGAPITSEDEGEDLFGEGMERDYDDRPDLDTYEVSDIDRETYDRLAVDAILNRRDRETRREAAREDEMRGRPRLPTALLGLDADVEPSQEEAEILRSARKRRLDGREDEQMDESAEGAREAMEEDATAEARERAEAMRRAIPKLRVEDLEGDGEETDIFYEEPRGSLREWIITERPRRVIARKFYVMLRSHQDENNHFVYVERVTQCCQQNRVSFEVSYSSLSQTHPQLAIWLADAPSEMLRIFDEVAFQFALRLFPDYRNITPEMHVRITDVPILDSLRDIRQLHLNSLIRTRGVVTRRTAVFPQLKIIKFNCGSCGHILGPYTQSSMAEIKLAQCPICQSRGPFRINQEETVYRNYQRLTLQESPGSVPPGRLPRSKDVIVLHDLIDVCRPGEEVEVVGIFRHNVDSVVNSEAGFPVFTTVIEANNVVKRSFSASGEGLTVEEISEIKKFGRDPQITERLVSSLAPSIFGHEVVKRAIILALFGGQRKDVGRKHQIRGDINVLILGDPGTAKSQFLKYCETVAQRAVFTTGQGASAVGLTASVQRDTVTKEWTLEGGALVLADNGVCLIDEFDKMNDRDRTSLHEAMEQQSISISKAGIVTTLQARCSVIAAANPLRGRYDASLTFSQNVELTDPILSRFDILCVVRDTADAESDERLAKFVVKSHVRSHPDYIPPVSGDGKEDLAFDPLEPGTIGEDLVTPAGLVAGRQRISPDLLKKYLQYARSHVFPKLHNMDEQKIMTFFKEMRRQSSAAGSIPITVRHIESIIRITEAHARMALRDFVRADDVDLALRVMTESFCAAQKFSVRRQLEMHFRQYLSYRTDSNRLLYYLLHTLVRDQLRYLQARHGLDQPSIVEVSREDFESRAREYELHDCSVFYRSPHFVENGYSIDTAKGKIVKRFD